jgi:hypothetical protein
MKTRRSDLRTTKKVKRKRDLMLRRLSKVKIPGENECRCEQRISRKRKE